MLRTPAILTNLLIVLVTTATIADDWPQWRGPSRDGVWRETGIIDQFPSEQLALSWRVPISSGYSGPTVAAGRVYVTDRLVEPRQVERILCFDAQSGTMLWSHEYDCEYSISYEAGPRASVSVDHGVAYALGAMGHLHSLDAKTGKVLWKKDLNADYKIRMPIWGIAASPLIYDDHIILQIGGSGNSCIIALDKKTGAERWSALDDRACYSAPILVQQNSHDVVVCWTGDSVAGIDPSQGKVHWRIPWAPRNMPIGISTPIVKGNQVFMTSFYDGSLMLKLSETDLTAKKEWQRVGRDEKNTDALQSIISTPLFVDDHLYGVDSYGELRCLDPDSGDRIWEDQTATPRARWSNIHFVTNANRVWMFNEVGELIIATLSPQGFHEISRAQLIDPTLAQLRQRNGVCWAHPAFANRHIFVRNDKELVCANLASE